MNDISSNGSWHDLIPDSERISTTQSYPRGKYIDLFEGRIYPVADDTVGDLRYYIYDPTAHGAPADRRYPLLFWLHGACNSLAGRMAINYAGAEMFASPEYQRLMGGAYIVVPLANERVDGEQCIGSWLTTRPGLKLPRYSPEARQFAEQLCASPLLQGLIGGESVYSPWLLALHDEVRARYTAIGETVLLGTSAGGFAAWRQLVNNPERFVASLIMAGAYLPDLNDLDIVETAGIPLWLCHGQHDECVPFALIEQNLERLRAMPNVELTLPEWVRNGDGGVASIVDRQEMGQHCFNAQIQQNLIYDDGTPYDPAHKQGVTGWIKRVVADSRGQQLRSPDEYE